MNKRNSVASRREFLTAAAAAVACPCVITSTALGGGGRPPAGQRIEVGGADHRVPGASKHARAVLIGHNHQDVGPFGHGCSLPAAIAEGAGSNRWLEGRSFRAGGATTCLRATPHRRRQGVRAMRVETGWDLSLTRGCLLSYVQHEVRREGRSV